MKTNYYIVLLAVILFVCSTLGVVGYTNDMDAMNNVTDGDLNETTSTETTETTEETTSTESTESTEETSSTDSTESTEETIPETTVEVIETGYFNVPLSEELQDHIIGISECRGLDPAIVMAMIKKESNFNPNSVGDNGNSIGLMQIQPRWHQGRMNELGVTDLFNPFDNVKVGIDYIADLLYVGEGSIEWALMAYNGGAAYANNMIAKGELSYYAKTILSIAENLERGY